MRRHPAWSLGLALVGLVLLLVGAIDPLEGFPLVLGGALLTLIAARVAPSRWLRLAAWGFGLAALGCAAMVVLSILGGVGGSSGRSWVWGLTILPYPAGALVGLVVAVLLVIERYRAPRVVI